MENELKYENANLRFENAKLKFETLYNERPSTFRSFAFHGILRVVYFILGLIGIVTGIIVTTYTTSVLVLIEKAKTAVEGKEEKYVVEKALDAALPTNVYLCAVIITLSLCLLIMARLCRKIVKRNLYIMDLETTWMELKDK